MQQEKIEQLKNLIRVSPLLNAAEREEWLSLTELMNDKQLLELERILQSPQPAATVASLAVQSAPEPARLSHIVNPPKVSAQAQRPAPAATPKAEDFFGKIKSALAEKELPSAPRELELPGGPVLAAVKTPPSFSLGTKLAQSSVRRPPVVPRPKIKTDKFVSPQAASVAQSNGVKPSVVAPAEKQAPRLGLRQDISSVQEKNKIQAMLVKAVSDNVRGLRPLSGPLAPAELKISGSEPRPFQPAASAKSFFDFQAEAGLADKPFGADAGYQQKGLDKWPELKELSEQPSARPAFPAGRVLGLPDLDKLSLSDFSQATLGELIKNLNQLIKNFGYHDVVFHLEKSPLFQAYIETGLDVLNNKAGFEPLGQAGSGKRLSRPQFEMFADVLRQMQAT